MERILYFLLVLVSVFYQFTIVSYLSPLLFFSILLLFLSFFRKEKGFVKISLLLIIINLVPLLGTVFSALRGQDNFVETSILTTVHRTAYILPLAIGFYNLKVSNKFIVYTFFFVLALLSLVSIVQVIQHYLGLNVFYIPPNHPSFYESMGTIILDENDKKSFRTSAFFAEPGDLAIYGSICTILILASYSINSFKKEVLLAWIFLFIILLTSKGLNAIFASFISIIYLFRRKIFNPKYLVYLIPAGLFALGVLYFLLLDRMDKLLSGEDSSYLVRIGSILNALNYVLSDFNLILFGSGLGTNAKVNFIGDVSIKSDYIRLLFDGGVVTVAAYILINCLIFFKRNGSETLRVFVVYFMSLGLFHDTQALYYLPLFLLIAWKLGLNEKKAIVHNG
ncbi:hypothetical protein C3K47_01795 [Solitalea longa]|uniref:Uncharacterized protein n=1 Tax=Solitalea longa TaxID=2079460 RepID=A0A2S5AA51_9SPHI|nr:hypothetical protein [Solitalea longa]POY39252.1 hypothetical protein C3K47_01795 [Solitalea longa]